MSLPLFGNYSMVMAFFAQKNLRTGIRRSKGVGQHAIGESHAENPVSVYSYKRGDVHMPLIKLVKVIRFDGFHYFGGVNEKNVNCYSSNLGGESLIAMNII